LDITNSYKAYFGHAETCEVISCLLNYGKDCIIVLVRQKVSSPVRPFGFTGLPPVLYFGELEELLPTQQWLNADAVSLCGYGP